MRNHAARLMRQATEEEQSSLQCSFGYTPRKGKASRRERDCTVDCKDAKGCATQVKKAYWLESKKC